MQPDGQSTGMEDQQMPSVIGLSNFQIVYPRILILRGILCDAQVDEVRSTQVEQINNIRIFVTVMLIVNQRELKNIPR